MPIELYVNPVKGDDTAPGNSLYPFKTLTRALKRVAPDTVIQLGRGTYNAESGEQFPIVLPTGVLIQGNVAAQGSGVILEGSGIYNSPTFGIQSVTVVLQGNSQLRGVTVTNSAAKGTGIWIESASPIVAGCTLAKCGREGVLATGTANPTITNCVFQENTASGLTFVRNTRGEVRNNVCRLNGFGVAISDRAAPLVANNQLLENRCGLVLSGYASPVVRSNIFAHNREDGLALFGQAKPDLGGQIEPAGNRFRDNQRFDLRNATPFSLIASGNQLNPLRVNGAVEFLTIRSPYASLLSSMNSTEMAARSGSTGSVPTSLGTHADQPERLAPIHAPADLRQHWAVALVQPLLDRRLLPVSPTGEFHPNAPIFATEFTDWLQSAGFSQAMGIDQVPVQPLTRLQVIKSLVLAADLVGGQSSLLNSYPDRAQVPSPQILMVATAIQHQLIVSADAGYLHPSHPITRAEAAAMLYQTLVAKGRAVAINAPQILNPSLTSGAKKLQPIQSGGDRPVVVLDPGHGGADPGVTTEVKSAEEEMMPPEGISPMEGLSGIPMSPLPAGMASPGMSPMMMPGSAGMTSPMPPRTSPMPPGMSEAMPSMPGEPSAMPSLQEKAIVLSVAQAVAGFLQQQGVQVILTRSDDRDISPAERLQTVTQNKADILVSIHANANTARQSDVNGIETYHASGATEGARLAWAIHKALTRTPDVVDRGVHPAYFSLLRNAPVPAVHVEVGYITGKTDAPSLANLAYHRYLARAIANGILRYVSQKGR